MPKFSFINCWRHCEKQDWFVNVFRFGKVKTYNEINYYLTICNFSVYITF